MVFTRIGQSSSWASDHEILIRNFVKPCLYAIVTLSASFSTTLFAWLPPLSHRSSVRSLSRHCLLVRHHLGCPRDLSSFVFYGVLIQVDFCMVLCVIGPAYDKIEDTLSIFVSGKKLSIYFFFLGMLIIRLYSHSVLIQHMFNEKSSTLLVNNLMQQGRFQLAVCLLLDVQQMFQNSNGW